MSPSEAILVVVIIALIAKLYCDRKAQQTGDMTVRGKPAPVKSKVTITYTRPQGGIASAEASSTRENLEHFATTATGSPADCDGDLAYATNPYGGADMDFKSWAAQQAVDPQVLKNHAEFVKDRSDLGGITTGRTYTPASSHDSYNPATGWVGLRKPQAVDTNNPTQVPDTDYAHYKIAPTFTWNSSATSTGADTAATMGA